MPSRRPPLRHALRPLFLRQAQHPRTINNRLSPSIQAFPQFFHARRRDCSHLPSRGFFAHNSPRTAVPSALRRFRFSLAHCNLEFSVYFRNLEHDRVPYLRSKFLSRRFRFISIKSSPASLILLPQALPFPN